MTAPRWDAPWTTPVGLAPQRPPGEPSFGQLALVHLAVWLGVSAVGGAAVAASRSGWSVLVVAALAGALGAVALRRGRAGLEGWVADLLLAIAATYLAGGVGVLVDDGGASSEAAVVAGSLVAAPVAVALYVLHRRLWLQVASVGVVTAALVSALQRTGDVPDGVTGAFLLVLAGFLALGCLSGVVRPVASGAVLAAVLGSAGSQVLLSEDTLLGSVVTLLLLAGIAAAVLQSRNRSLLPVALVAGALLLPQVLRPALGTDDAIGLSITSVVAAVAWLAVDLQRRSVRPVQVGGVFAVGLFLVLVSGFSLSIGGSAPSAGEKLAAVLQSLAVAAFFGACAAARRRPATVITGLLTVTSVPSAFAEALGGGAGLASLFGLISLGAVVWLAIQLDWRAPRPAASPWQQESSLTGEGREWTVLASYPQVFDAVVGVLGSAGVALQLVDRAAGRVVAGDAAAPVLVVAVWSSDAVQTRLRAVGAPWDVDRLEADVTARLNGLDAPH